MCGIAGISVFNESNKHSLINIEQAVKSLSLRGPDKQGTYYHHNTALGHARLSVIDISDSASQPFTDESGRWTIVFNGEFFNFKEHKKQLEEKGVRFRTSSDTEVLLQLFIQDGVNCLQKINGFFAFAIYDKETEKLFLARDRFGIKPLLIYHDNDKLLFASEMKAMIQLGIPKELDYESLYSYLHLNYVLPPYSIFKNVLKLSPGSYLESVKGAVTIKNYYSIPTEQTYFNYDVAKNDLSSILENAVEQRLVSDVPLGAFLSGGIDSSIITAIAAQKTDKLNTFSIGYKDEPYFDETHYARLVAKMHKTEHTVFSLSNDDLFNNLYQVLDYTDEPFADSSSLAVNMLSMYTRKHVKVALSGDGADELFGGYNKHQALLFSMSRSPAFPLLKLASPIIKKLPQSRNSSLFNKFRQLNRLAEGLSMPLHERYWRWAGYATETQLQSINRFQLNKQLFSTRKNQALSSIKENNINSILYTDVKMLLQGDMLTKVDLMSMANSLEVRVPFLDYRVVECAFGMPGNFKINAKARKKILIDTFSHLLPGELLNRKKQGFEVPLLKWFRTELNDMINNDLLKDSFIREQGLFNESEIQNMKKALHSINPGDITARIWGLIVFQYWWKKYYV